MNSPWEMEGDNNLIRLLESCKVKVAKHETGRPASKVRHCWRIGGNLEVALLFCYRQPALPIILALLFSTGALAQDDALDVVPLLPADEWNCFTYCMQTCNTLQERPLATCEVECGAKCSGDHLIVHKSIFIHRVDPGYSETIIDLQAMIYIPLDRKGADYYTVVNAKIATLKGSISGYDSDGPFKCEAQSAEVRAPLGAIVVIAGNKTTGKTKQVHIPPHWVEVNMVGTPSCSGVSTALATVDLATIKGLGGRLVSTEDLGDPVFVEEKSAHAERWHFKTDSSSAEMQQSFSWALFLPER